MTALTRRNSLRLNALASDRQSLDGGRAADTEADLLTRRQIRPIDMRKRSVIALIATKFRKNSSARAD